MSVSKIVETLKAGGEDFECFPTTQEERARERQSAQEATTGGTRESFIFHADFIEDLPERFRADFALYAAEYGLYGKEPPIEDEFSLEMTIWKKIARVIDAEREVDLYPAQMKLKFEKSEEAAEKK